MEIAEVETASGVPIWVIRNGSTWHVAPDPVRWFERLPWWQTARRAERGGPLKIDVEVWKVQARIGRNPRTPLVTFELVFGQDRESWGIRAMNPVAA